MHMRESTDQLWYSTVIGHMHNDPEAADILVDEFARIAFSQEAMETLMRRRNCTLPETINIHMRFRTHHSGEKRKDSPDT